MKMIELQSLIVSIAEFQWWSTECIGSSLPQRTWLMLLNNQERFSEKTLNSVGNVGPFQSMHTFIY